MTAPDIDPLARRKPLRLWPGVVVVALQWTAWTLVPVFDPDAVMIAVAGGVLGGLALLVWWAFFSRAAVVERVGAIVLAVAAMAFTPRILHESVAGAGMGLLFFIYAIPALSLAFVAWAVATRDLPDRVRRLTMVATVLLAVGGWALVRTGGITGSTESDFAWRWTATAEDRLLALDDGDLPGTPITVADTGAPDVAVWPGFRGPERDSIVRGVTIAVDWNVSPPVEVWRRPVGPGWSSFAVRGNVIYTQEQRGEEEVVAAYHLDTGAPVWRHGDAVRFWESNGGAGPRATPTVSDGHVYTFGATGILNAVEAGNGSSTWARDVAADLGVPVPDWGFTSSPVVVDGVVIVAASGKLAAYDQTTGEPLWVGPTAGGSYSSPHLVTLDGVTQILLQSGAGITSVAPADGTVLWQHEWPGARIVQPAVMGAVDLLVTAAGDAGGIATRRLAIGQGQDGWTADEIWTSNRLKPYFNDFVVHEAHAYGFDGAILACIDLEAGERQWKGGRYGHGQLLLLPDQDLLLVLSEEGELALVSATPGGFTELARFPALEGKTWNHPVLIGDLLVVRNGEEMAAFRLAVAGN